MGDKAAHAEYELRNNVLLKAIRPGGLLYDYVENGPVEVLCAPQQSFLESSGIALYLRLPPPPSGNSTTITATLTVGEQDVVLTPEQHQKIARITREAFLDYHLMHFDSVASPAFVTIRGQRGEFSVDLQSVARYGRIGASEVICDMSPFLEPNDTSVTEFHPCKLHIFVIAKALMDEEELHNTLSDLQRALLPKERTVMVRLQGDQTRCVEGATEPRHLKDHFSREAISNYRRAVAKDNDVCFKEFQDLMRLPACAPVAKTISNFVETIQQREAPLFDNADLKRATSFCLDQCKRIPLFEKDASKLHIAAEGFETYIMSKLYWRAFDVHPEERERNKELQDKLLHLSPLVKAEQLDALEEVEKHPLWDQAMFELEGMNIFKTPREKLCCAVRACGGLTKAVSSALMHKGKGVDRTSNSTGSEVNSVACGADEFLPCFMLLVLRASPRDYYLNVQYVKRFRDSDLITLQESYCLANLESAAEFWLSYTNSLPCQGPSSSPPTPPATIIEDLFLSPVTADPPGQPIEKDEVYTVPQQLGASSRQHLAPLVEEESLTLGNELSVALDGGQEGINVAKLLLEEGKSFDNLTVVELRAIVGEARLLLAEKHKLARTVKESSE
ncbi:putative MCAK-like kinesin [Trypanosoma rangeli]|uniref:Putative MCAK-like kinesin n=1 Tax=Trypanosoma rangeli TaxID=5698 RepID=A0A422P5A2_TRYRA|nr:putative MCAK-like kinesin [Trypanosoma rangeli]RNF12891.1 putative MCAK-like kinesin [Trypanosoma rangeli]|eukprot:RNF12891.1 putative MCAK-like kinesin [Trypanosoma rangeli]